MRITVIGTGYVGLTVGVCLAETGNDVTCVDKDQQVVNRLSQGKLTFHEPELDDLLKRNVTEDRLKFTTDIGSAINKGDIIYITVGTPPDDDGSADLSAVLNVAESIGEAMDEPKIVVNKSTVPVGTADKVREKLAQNTDHDFHVVSNPEFLKEGNAVDDFMKPDRIVVGTDSEEVEEIFEDLYEPFVRTTGNPILFMDNRSAEMVKYAANTMLASRVSLMNELANLSEELGADIENVRRGIGYDHRIGTHFIFAGTGYGGSCFPKDVQALINLGEQKDTEMKLARAIHRVNEQQKKILAEKIINYLDGDMSDKKVAVWGLSFKPGTDDMRNAPSINLVNNLVEHNAEVVAHDPIAIENAKEELPEEVNFDDDQYLALKDADALAIVTEWKKFRNPNFDKMKEFMSNPAIFDGRNIYDPDKLTNLGFYYEGIGRTTG
ncbi:UDP-glucose/GDP-mannose dehydrogenase family protein [Candidatus Bipolaricaulota bacterium]|nr:UDP-glucose/GDP-mannose dehydrogenase family protein [Candidatus Bipolaricaulota bacterium]